MTTENYVRSPDAPQVGDHSPWGQIDFAAPVEFNGISTDGIVQVATPSHGGFWLSPERLAELPPELQTADGWYEEDCEWIVVARQWPDGFVPELRETAQMMFDQYYPDGFRPFRG